MSIITPTKRVGSKSHLAPWIISHLPVHDTYVEVFGGTGAVLLNKTPSPREVYNDIDGNLHNLYVVLRDRNDDLSRALALTQYSREEFDEACDYIARERGPKDDPVEWARQYVVFTRQCFVGGGNRSWSITRNGSLNSTTWANLPESILRLHDRLRGVAIECLDYPELVKKWDTEQATLYFDPPYEGIEKAYYQANKSDGFDHKALRNTIEIMKASVVVSYYKSDYVRDLYEGFEIFERHGQNQIGNNRRPVTELLLVRWSPWAQHRRRRPRKADLFPDADRALRDVS